VSTGAEARPSPPPKATWRTPAAPSTWPARHRRPAERL